MKGNDGECHHGFTRFLGFITVPTNKKKGVYTLGGEKQKNLLLSTWGQRNNCVCVCAGDMAVGRLLRVGLHVSPRDALGLHSLSRVRSALGVLPAAAGCLQREGRGGGVYSCAFICLLSTALP